MRHIKWIVAVLIAGLVMPITASSQVCGDASGDGWVTISDMVRIMAHLWGDDDIVLTPQADCDDRLGVTVSDQEAIVQYIFQVFEPSVMDCSIGRAYNFEPSLTDTVFLPYMSAIPDEIISVSLPIITSFSDETRAFYLPMACYETNGPGRFELVEAERQDPYMSDVQARIKAGDSAFVIGTEMEPSQNALAGHHNFYNLVFSRVQSGEAAINCSQTFRSAVMRMAVKKGDDLYVPVIQYYEVPVPTPVVTVSPSTLNITATAGLWSVNSYSVTFTSDIQPVSFTLATSDTWIVIEDFSPTGYTTPATITVRANASATPSGSYAGQITFGDIDPADATVEPAAIDVALTVLEPVIYPPGDLNCDGLVSIGDIVLLIDCLFIDVRPVPPCE